MIPPFLCSVSWESLGATPPGSRPDTFPRTRGQGFSENADSRAKAGEVGAETDTSRRSQNPTVGGPPTDAGAAATAP